MAEESKPKWEGKAIVELGGTSAHRVWPLIEDFFNLHKLLPIDTCYQVESVQGQPGLTRYCATSTTKGVDGGGGAADHTTILWAKERLLTIDPIQRCLSYDIVDSNMGFKSYVATMKVVPLDDGVNKHGCKIEWGFVSDPVQGWRFQDFNSYIESSLETMAKKIELACSVPT